MFFVAPAHQRKGIGKALLAAVLPQMRGDVVTVRASLSYAPAYVGYGFECSGEVGEVAGLVYQPMTLTLDRAGKPGFRTCRLGLSESPCLGRLLVVYNATNRSSRS